MNISISIWAPILISVLSLIVSLFIALKQWRFNEISIRNFLRSDYKKLLLELDKEVIHSPELFSIFDSHPLAKTKSADPLVTAKREGFIYLHLNLFEMAYNSFQSPVAMNKSDRSTWAAIEKYICQFLQESKEARAIFMRRDTQEIYPQEFVSFMNSLLSKIEKRAVK